MAIPGPMAAWAKSTGAILPLLHLAQRLGQLRPEGRPGIPAEWLLMHQLREGRQTRTMLEARALVSMPTNRFPSSVRTGQVPVTAKPA